MIPIKVLMVEDSEDDALLLIRTLRKSGYEPDIERVQTAEDMTFALLSRPWNIILCDYHLPRFSGIEAIALVKKLNLDIAIIVVSGGIGEETAIDCIHRGASDYIMKGKLARLGLAVERELEKKSLRDTQKQNEVALRQSEEKYRTILENIGDGYYEADLKGNLTFFNDALCGIWGYPREELMGMNNRNYMDRETSKRLYLASNNTYVTGKPEKLFECEIISKDGSPKSIMTSFALKKDPEGKTIGFRGIVRDVTTLKRLERERQESLERLKKSLADTIHAMAVTVESRDPYTAGHQRRVAELAVAIARELKLDENRIEGLRMASIIHDLGKISVPSEILTKPTKLTAIEFEIVKVHAQAGYEILKDIDFPWPIARIVVEHHERIDGSGYPNRLTSEKILQESKILAVSDVVEAMASHRPYRPSLGIEPALAEITKNRGKFFDEDIVDACLKLFREKDFCFTA